MTQPILAPERLDDVALALLTLTKEVWVLADRMHVVETLLERNGVVTAEAIDRFEPDAAFTAENDRRRRRLADGVFAALGATE